MFETNTDLEFDEIFGDSFGPQKIETLKRSYENPNLSDEANKRSCLDTIPAKSMLFLKKIDEIPSNIMYKSQTKPLGTSQFQSNSKSFNSSQHDILNLSLSQIDKTPSNTMYTSYTKPMVSSSPVHSNSKSSFSSSQGDMLSSLLKQIDEFPNNTIHKTQTKPVVSSAGLQINSSQQDISRSPLKKVVLRKFPGPAGLLPERKGCNKTTLETNIKESKQDEMEICSQLTVKAFREGPWEQMRKDFSSTRELFLPDKYNIAWIKSKMKHNELINHKAPFLATIIIKKIESLKLKKMILKDGTGQIHGTIMHDLYEEYENVLKPGSVVILKQFGVLTTDHITITANNLVAVYSKKNDAVGSEKVVKTVIQKLSAQDFLKNIEEVKLRHKAVMLEQKLNFGVDFSRVHLNLKSISSGNLNGSRTESVNFLTNQNKNIQREAGLTPNKSLSINNRSNSSNRNLLNNSQISVASSSSPVNLNKEHGLGLSNSANKQKFNFKTHVEQTPQMINKSPVLENNSNQIVITNNIRSQPINNDKGSVIKCSQISISCDNLEHIEILQNVFEGVDADLLFEDF